MSSLLWSIGNLDWRLLAGREVWLKGCERAVGGVGEFFRFSFC